MSLLWSQDNKAKYLLKKGKPSPTHRNHFPGSARNPDIFPEDGTNRLSVKARFMKGTSLFTLLSKRIAAGMTVEASIVLPLFLFFFLNLGCAIEMIRLHGNLQLALWQIGTKMSVYGYVLDSGEMPENGDGWWRDLAGAVVSSTYVKGQVVSAAGADYLNSSPLSDGAASLQLWESEIFGSEDEIDIVVTYSVSPWSRLIGFLPFRMANRYYGHIWNGYELSGDGMNDDTTQIVYVTENGTVYHLSVECTHLQLTVQQVPAAGIDEVRNKGGGRYYPCAKCADGRAPSTLYITNEGDRYHYNKGCSGLKRTVSSMTIEQAQEAGYRQCSRCGG